MPENNATCTSYQHAKGLPHTLRILSRTTVTLNEGLVHVTEIQNCRVKYPSDKQLQYLLNFIHIDRCVCLFSHTDVSSNQSTCHPDWYTKFSGDCHHARFEGNQFICFHHQCSLLMKTNLPTELLRCSM